MEQPAETDQAALATSNADVPITQNKTIAALSVPVFAAWDPELFVDTDVSNRIHSIIEANRGGNYGLTGPRGAGKSWLLNQAVKWANSKGGLGMLFPSPSREEPGAFLAALSEVFAQTYINDYIQEHPLSATPEDRRRRMVIASVSVLFVYLGGALIFLGLIGKHAPKFSGLVYAGGIIIIASLVSLVAVSGRLRRKRTSVYDLAIEFRRQARFATVFGDSSNLSGSISRLGTSLGFNKSRAEQFTERPVTLSSLVHGFREFCKNVVGAVKGPVVIAIDELDKVESTNDVIELLRAIKGIFDIRGVHYFVSVSDEAARRLQLSGIRERDEFNSSFYQVFELPRAGMEIIDAIIEKRGIKRLAENEAAAVEVFCSGIPREAIRLIDILRNELDDDMMGFDDWPIWSILNAEVAAFQKDVQSAKDGRILDSDRRIVGQPLEVRLTPGAGPAEIYELWDMSDTSEGFRTRYSKDFRRLLNRVAVGQILRRRPPKLYIEVLEEAIMANERDPSLGRLAIDRCMSQLGIAYSPSPLSPAQHEQT